MGQPAACIRDLKTHTSLASILKTVDLILGLPPLNQYDAAATDLRDIFTGTPDFSSYAFQTVPFVQRVNSLWLALTKDVDFSRPDADEVKLRRNHEVRGAPARKSRETLRRRSGWRRPSHRVVSHM
jgi:hypothetical protein